MFPVAVLWQGLVYCIVVKGKSKLCELTFHRAVDDGLTATPMAPISGESMASPERILDRS